MNTFKVFKSTNLERGDEVTKRMFDPFLIAARLKQLRKEKGITQADLADGAKIGLSTVKQYESGKRVPEKYILTQLANYFGVLEEWITGQSEYKTAFAKLDAELGEEGLEELRNQVNFLSWLENNFEFHCEDYTAEQLERLDSEIREFIKFKITQMEKCTKKGKGEQHEV